MTSPKIASVRSIPLDHIIKVDFSSPEQEVEIWYKRLKEWVEFDLLNKPDTLAGMVRLQEYRDIIFTSAKENAIDPYWFMAILLVESSGKPDAVSPTGATGIAQFIKSTATENGLKIVFEPVFVSVKEKVRVKKGKKTITKIVVRKKQIGEKCVRDDRLNPDLAIPVAAELLGKYSQKFKDRHLAALAYHSGRQAAINVLDYSRKNLDTYVSLFLSLHPVRDKKGYSYLFNLPDFASTYPFRVERATELLELYDQDAGKSVAKLAEQYQVKNMGVTKNRFWLWYPQPVTYARVEDLEQAIKRQQLFALRRNTYPGFYLRTEPDADNSSFIGDFYPDKTKRWVFRYSKPETLGLLLLFGQLLHEVQGQDRFQVRITSLTRDHNSQKSGGQFENTRWPMHPAALAFDISQRDITEHQRNVIRFVLWRLSLWGFVSFMEEKPGGSYNAWHLVPSPAQDKVDILIGIFNQADAQVQGGN